MWCDCCGDMVAAAKQMLIVYPSGKSRKAMDDLVELLQRFGYDVLPINVCLDCWRRDFKGSRKLQVAAMMRILAEE